MAAPVESFYMITPPRSPVPENIRNEYDSLVAELDRLIFSLTRKLQGFINCNPGCSSCCRRFSVLPLEAALIAASPATTLRRLGSEDLCSFLTNGLCSIYAQRPLICRTQGLPIGYIDEENERIEVSACSLNFPEYHPFEYGDLLLLDTFNSRLAALNRSYCRAAEIATDLRLPLG